MLSSFLKSISEASMKSSRSSIVSSKNSHLIIKRSIVILSKSSRPLLYLVAMDQASQDLTAEDCPWSLRTKASSQAVGYNKTRSVLVLCNSRAAFLQRLRSMKLILEHSKNKTKTRSISSIHTKIRSVNTNSSRGRSAPTSKSSVNILPLTSNSKVLQTMTTSKKCQSSKKRATKTMRWP